MKKFLSCLGLFWGVVVLLGPTLFFGATPVSAHYESEKYTIQPWLAVTCAPTGPLAAGLPVGWADPAFGTTTYYALMGSVAAYTTEAWCQTKIYSPHTVSRTQIRVYSNTCDGVSTLVSRKNGANGAISITIGAGVTGNLSDLVNIESLDSGDYFNWALTVGGTAGRVAIEIISAEMTGKYIIVKSWDAFWSAAAPYVAGDKYCVEPIGGTLAGFSVVTFPITGVPATDWAYLQNRFIVNDDLELSNLRVYVSANNADAAVTVSDCDVTDNTTFSLGSLSVTIGSGATGEFEDTTHTANYYDGDKVLWMGDATSATAGKKTSCSLLQAELDYVGMIHCVSWASGITTSSLRRMPIYGSMASATTDSQVWRTVNDDYTLKYLQLGLENGMLAKDVARVDAVVRLNGDNTTLAVSNYSETVGAWHNVRTSINDTGEVSITSGDNVSLTLCRYDRTSGSAYAAFVAFVMVPDLLADPAAAPVESVDWSGTTEMLVTFGVILAIGFVLVRAVGLDPGAMWYAVAGILYAVVAGVTIIVNSW